MQDGLPIVVIVLDNGMFDTIRMHQQRAYPGLVAATDLRNPDSAAHARPFGGHGDTLRATAEFGPAPDRAFPSGMPAVIHCLLDPDAILPGAIHNQLRRAARAGQGGA